jgi:hypothetical protein
MSTQKGRSEPHEMIPHLHPKNSEPIKEISRYTSLQKGCSDMEAIVIRPSGFINQVLTARLIAEGYGFEVCGRRANILWLPQWLRSLPQCSPRNFEGNPEIWSTSSSCKLRRTRHQLESKSGLGKLRHNRHGLRPLSKLRKG